MKLTTRRHRTCKGQLGCPHPLLQQAFYSPTKIFQSGKTVRLNSNKKKVSCSLSEYIKGEGGGRGGIYSRKCRHVIKKRNSAVRAIKDDAGSPLLSLLLEEKHVKSQQLRSHGGGGPLNPPDLRDAFVVGKHLVSWVSWVRAFG